MSALTVQAEVSLLNVSYDVSRDVFKSYNPLFQKYWKTKNGEEIVLKQSHSGSSKQVRAVADGVEADVVTMNQLNDIEFLVEKGLVAKDWNKKFPNNASPYTSTMVFIVRKGNPKGIKDWDDLVKPGLQVILPHPKNTGNGRNSYLSAWAWAVSYTHLDVYKRQGRPGHRHRQGPHWHCSGQRFAAVHRRHLVSSVRWRSCNAQK